MGGSVFTGSDGRPAAIVLAAIGGGAIATAIVLRLWVDLPYDAMVEGLAFTGAGLAAWARRPENRIGKLMIAYTFLVWSIHLQKSGIPLLWTAGSVLFPVAVFVLVPYLILAFPQGRLKGTLERFLIGVLAADVAWQIGSLLFLDPVLMGCPDCPPGLNLLLLRADPDRVLDMAVFNPWWLSVGMFGIIAVLIARWLRASRPARRVIGPILVPGVAYLAANRLAGLAEIYFIIEAPGAIDEVIAFVQRPALLETLSRVEQIAITILPITFLLGLARARLRHARVSKLVVELGDLATPSKLEDALARALGDPSLKIGIWDPSSARYVRGNEELPEPGEGSSLVATRLERRGKPLALMIHDQALLDDPGLVEATGAAARLTVENEQLQAEIEAQLAEVRASRQRIVAAQDEERRKLERDLHDGAQQRLLRLSMALQVASSSMPEQPDPALRTSLEVAAEELQSALRELRDLAQGIHPTVLTQRGLGAAIRTLAESATLPVVVESVPAERLPAEVEGAGYFFVSEALANVSKHASASVAAIDARVSDSDLVISVSDDGVGGADRSRGSGLKGLADRIEALDGKVEFDSDPGGGTRLVARIPVPTKV